MYINMNDIKSRQYNLVSQNNNKSQFNLNEMKLYTKNNKFMLNNAYHMITHWYDFSEDTNIAFRRALDVFDEVCNNCNASVIKDHYQILYEAESKVRDASQLAYLIKHRLSRYKTKIYTKINKQINDNDTINDRKVNNVINKNAENLSKVSYKKPSVGGVAPSSSQGSESTPDTDGVAEACYAKLLENAYKMSECDRIIRNYNKISKRFNMNKTIAEMNYIDDIYDTIVEMTSQIDTYNTNIKSKYNSAIENSYYVLSKNHIDCSPEKIIEAVTDYFIFNTELTDNDISDMKYVSENSNVFPKEKFKYISHLTKEIPVKESKIITGKESANNYGVDFYVLNEESLKDTVKDWKKGNPNEHDNDEINKLIDDFRDSCKNKKPENLSANLKALVIKIFTKNPEQIIRSLPNLFTIIRVFFILGSCAINPILPIVTFIGDRIIKITLDRKQTKKIIDLYTKEIDKTKSKIEKAKSESTKDRLEKYLDALKKDLNKIKEYDNNLYTDDENDERNAYSYDDDFDDDEFNFDGDEFNFEESEYVNMASMCVISELVQSINEALLDTNVDGIVYNNIFKFNSDTLDAITDFSITVPVILEKTKIKESLIDHRAQLRKNKNDINSLMRIDCINENINKINNSTNTYNVINDIKGTICCLKWLDEMVTNCKSEYIMEMDFSNTLKLAMNKLKKNATNLSTKEKQISNQIDASVATMSRGIQDSITNTNREAVIRGTILPSASKTIKIALATGAAWAVSPSLAVIGVLGMFACSAKLRPKERQLVLDDIDVELKMCERYMRLAEEKNDMKAVRQIEQNQRALERQKQRIKYKMNTIYKQSVPKIGENDD